MLGRKNYTRAEIDGARVAVADQLAAWQRIGDPSAESTYFAVALLALDRRFVHRVRTVTGKDTNRSARSRCSPTRCWRTACSATSSSTCPRRPSSAWRSELPSRSRHSSSDDLATAFLGVLETTFLDG